MNFKTSYINQYFDQVYVLNLAKRPDRKIAMFKKLNRLGIKAEFVQAIDGHSDENIAEHQYYLRQSIGGKNSHKLEREYQRKLINSPGGWGYLKTYFGILQDAKKRNFQRILCFDDDVIFHKDFEDKFKECTQLIPDDWKLIYLGASQYVWKIPHGFSYTDKSKKAIDKDEPFYFPNNTDGSFAMGIHASVFDLLIRDILEMNCPFDSGPLRTVIHKHPKKCFVFTPNLAIADVSDSDIREGQDQQKLSERLKWDLIEYDFNSKKDLVSVIMPAYNASKTIEKAIRSILMQSYADLEIIVVNDASTDNTIELVEKMMPEDSRIRLINLEENLGVGGARNAGLKESRGSFIAFQDADDVSLKDRLAKQLIPIYEKDVLFTASNIYRSRCEMNELDITNQQSMLTLIKSRRNQNWMGEFDYLDKAHIGLVTTVFKREVFEKFGLFGPHRFGEDMEFIERVLYHSLKEEFHKGFNGHSFLSQNKHIPKIYQRIDDVLFICSAMGQNNLSIQYGNKQEENVQRSDKFRKKYRSKGLAAFPKLASHKTSEDEIAPIVYNTLFVDNFLTLPKAEYALQGIPSNTSRKKQIVFSKIKLISISIIRWFSSLLGRFNALK